MQTRSKNHNNEMLLRIAPFAIGSTASMVEVICNHPMWIIKTVMQTEGTNNNTSPAQKITAKDLLNPRLLYSGVLANALGMIPATALRFGTNDTLRYFFAADSNHPTFLENLFCMSTAGVSASFVCSPVDLVNTMKYKLKRQALLFPEQKIGTSFTASAAYLIQQQNGLQCLRYGLPATMLREATYTPFFFGMTPYVRSKVKPYTDNDTQATIVSGISTGMTAAAATQPLDTIKTRQQDIQLNQKTKPDNWVTTVSKIYKEGGLAKFFAGGFWRMARISSAIPVMTLASDKMYDEINKKMK